MWTLYLFIQFIMSELPSSWWTHETRSKSISSQDPTTSHPPVKPNKLAPICTSANPTRSSKHSPKSVWFVEPCLKQRMLWNVCRTVQQSICKLREPEWNQDPPDGKETDEYMSWVENPFKDFFMNQNSEFFNATKSNWMSIEPKAEESQPSRNSQSTSSTKGNVHPIWTRAEDQLNYSANEPEHPIQHQTIYTKTTSKTPKAFFPNLFL